VTRAPGLAIQTEAHLPFDPADEELDAFIRGSIESIAEVSHNRRQAVRAGSVTVKRKCPASSEEVRPPHSQF
jgi:hypothetical protein